eukprot:8338238-Karenia_brevis.AAC.1
MVKQCNKTDQLQPTVAQPTMMVDMIDFILSQSCAYAWLSSQYAPFLRHEKPIELPRSLTNEKPVLKSSIKGAR